VRRTVVRNSGQLFILERRGMKKQVWIRQELFDEAKQRCAVLEAENAALKADVASLRIAQQRKGETVRSCLTCGKFINCSTPLSNCGYDYWIPHTASPVA